jgi:hypothetical protein
VKNKLKFNERRAQYYMSFATKCEPGSHLDEVWAEVRNRNAAAADGAEGTEVANEAADKDNAAGRPSRARRPLSRKNRGHCSPPRPSGQ